MSIPLHESTVVEAMARAMCLAAGGDPDESVPLWPHLDRNEVTLRWHCYIGRALQQYRAHNAMMQAIVDELIRN